MDLTLEDRTNFLILDERKQLSSKVYRPSLSLGETILLPANA